MYFLSQQSPLQNGTIGKKNHSSITQTTTTTTPVSNDRDDQYETPRSSLIHSDGFNSNGSTTSPPSPNVVPRRSNLTLLPFVILIFYNVSGGPFGIEPTIKAGGNLCAILGFTIFPLIWSIPEVLVTAELGSAFSKDASGGVAWVEEAFGEKMGLICGYLDWVSGAVDNAIYPALLLEYLTGVILDSNSKIDDDGAGAGAGEGEGTISAPELALELRDNGWIRFCFVSLLTVLLAWLNYTGLEIVGKASLVVCIISMSPFVIMCILGLPQVDPEKWLQLPLSPNEDDDNDDNSHFWFFSGILWRPFLNNLFWNLNSFDAGANFAGEVDDLKTTYPKGLFWSLLLCVTCYLIPLLVATGATNSNQEDWVDGYLANVATEIGGSWLGGWTVFGVGLSNLALFEAEMLADSYMIMGMADRGILPKIFQTRSVRYGTPTYGIILSLVVIIFLNMADFSQLVEILNLNYALSLLMKYAAFVKLRFSRKDLERPFKVPIPDWATFLLVLTPSIGIIVIFTVASWITNVFVIFVVILGVALHRLRWFLEEQQWCEFERIVHNSEIEDMVNMIRSMEIV